jgi:phospholipid/cholesterol/gamma-HCH transport system substrate-binding protein
MEKSTSQKIRLGLFVIIGLTLFVLAVYFIGEKQKMFGETSNLKTVFTNVSGLQLGNNVRYSGLNVGTVRGINMKNDTTIVVDMIIDKSIFEHINKDAIASISSDGLVGNMIINILPGKGIERAVVSGDTIHSVNRIRTEDVLNTLNTSNENISKITNDLLSITNKINTGKGTIGLLINDTLIGNDLKQTLHYLKITGKGTTVSIDNLNTIIRSLDDKNNLIGVIKDTAMAHKIKSIIINLDKSSKDVNKVITNLNGTILQIKEGKGALNYLSNDPKLVQKIDSTMTNINQASFRLNEDLEAVKHNFLFRGYFKKQAKAKAKAAKKTN